MQALTTAVARTALQLGFASWQSRRDARSLSSLSAHYRPFVHIHDILQYVLAVPSGTTLCSRSHHGCRYFPSATSLA